MKHICTIEISLNMLVPRREIVKKSGTQKIFVVRDDKIRFLFSFDVLLVNCVIVELIGFKKKI